jgi:hypothetical protein
MRPSGLEAEDWSICMACRGYGGLRNLSNQAKAGAGILRASQRARNDAMAVFAFLYRPTRSLTSAELADRAQRIRPWALGLRESGQVLVVSAFDEAACVLKHDGELDENHESPLAGCTLVSAADLPAALELARGFPGRAFGTDVEVRAVKTFLPPVAQ